MKKLALVFLLLVIVALTIPKGYATPPTVETYDTYCIHVKNSFCPYDEVYVRGDGFAPNDIVNIVVTPYKSAWTDGDLLVPLRINQTQTDSLGYLPCTSLGKFIIDCYDIVVDTDQDGIYDAATDALDANDTVFGGGFFVTCCLGGVVVPINKLSILAQYIGLTSIVAIGAIVAFIKCRKRKAD